MTAYLLGAYQGNRHLSIDNYLKYCERELPPHLPGWKLSSKRPGCFPDNYFPISAVPRLRAWNDNFLKWPLTLSKLNGDLYHIVDQGLAWYRLFLRRGKTVITVNDLINLLIIRGHLRLSPVPPRRRAFINATARQINRADAVICCSQNTADTVMSELSVPAKRIHIVHHIVPKVFRPVPAEERTQARGSLIQAGEHLVLHVGKASTYKNRMGVLKAFDLLYQKLPSCRLAVTGQCLTQEEHSFIKDRAWASRVIETMPESQEDLRLLYGACDVLLFPSLYEGFGWPPLEAMACGCPVVTSAAGSLREVVGTAGTTIEDPLDAQAFADAALRVINEPSLTTQLKDAGFRRASEFTAEKLTPQLADVYRKLTA